MIELLIPFSNSRFHFPLSSTADGEVFSFGQNDYGQLGDGTTTNRNVPVAVSTSGVLNGKTITAIAAGGFHSFVFAVSCELCSIFHLCEIIEEIRD